MCDGRERNESQPGEGLGLGLGYGTYEIDEGSYALSRSSDKARCPTAFDL
jgi:hypothetical protein